MEIRKELIVTLLKHFLADLDRAAKPLTNVEDRIYFAKTLSEFLTGVYNVVPENEYFEAFIFDEENFIQEKLLSKFRDKMSEFINSNLRYYFSKEEAEQKFLFKKLNIEQAPLSYGEYEDYILRVNFLLNKIVERLYLSPAEAIKAGSPDSQVLIEQSEEEYLNENIKSRSKDYSRSRQILLYYFMLKLLGVTRLNISVSKQAQFAHVLFNYPIDNIDNSQVYKKLKLAPLVNKIDKDLLKDLEFVKQQFELIEHEQGVALVQAEINSTKEAMKKNKR